MSPPQGGSRYRARSRARSWALQFLYGWELVGESGLGDYVARTLPRRRISDRYRPYAERLLEVVERHLSEIDDAIERYTANWRLERLDAIDRNVLRIGIAELRHMEDIPPKVAIQEAVRLSRRYGGAESPRFVNGVLDAVYKGRDPEP